MIQSTAWPEADVGLDIHTRLAAGDPVASADLAEQYLDCLANWVVRTNPRVDSHMCEQAAGDALLALIKNPASYNPDKLSLDAYLRMSASGDVKNLLEREKRHAVRRENLEIVELFGAGRNAEYDEDPALIIDREDAEPSIMDTIAPTVEHLFTDEERAVLELLGQDERRTEPYARLLGITDLPVDEQRREVKKVKDRIKRRLQRARGTT